MQHDTDQVTNLPLADKVLVPNIPVHKLIRQWREDNPIT